MSRNMFRALSVITLLAYLLLPATAQAHETVTFGDYSVLYGWEVEPPVAGQPNAIILTITEGAAHSEGGAHSESDTAATATIHVNGSAASGTPEPAAEDGDHEHGTPSSVGVSGMTIEIAYGGETKVLTLEPVWNGAPGEYLARVTPSRAGRYTVRLGGQLGDTPVSAEVEPQEVMGAEVLAFPAGAGTASGPATAVDGAGSTARTALTIAIVSLVTGLLGLGVGTFAVVRRGK